MQILHFCEFSWYPLSFIRIATTNYAFYGLSSKGWFINNVKLPDFLELTLQF